MINEINAELLLDTLYPELAQQWTVRNKGTFYRNYSTDALDIYPEEHLVELSRDSMLKLLPPEMLSAGSELATTDENGKPMKIDQSTRLEMLKERLHLLTEAFMPFDTFRFRTKLKVEQQVSEILDMKLRWVLLTCFDYDIDKETDEYVLEAAMLLPYVTQLRGHAGMVRNLLSLITGYEVKLRQTSYSQRDNTQAWMPKLHYDILVPGLDSEGYLGMMKRFSPLFEFIKERFIPIEAFCDMNIVDLQKRQVPKTTSPIANYNAYVRK